jgi:hypothetical protein
MNKAYHYYHGQQDKTSVSNNHADAEVHEASRDDKHKTADTYSQQDKTLVGNENPLESEIKQSLVQSGSHVLQVDNCRQVNKVKN